MNFRVVAESGTGALNFDPISQLPGEWRELLKTKPQAQNDAT